MKVMKERTLSKIESKLHRTQIREGHNLCHKFDEIGIVRKGLPVNVKCI